MEKNNSSMNSQNTNSNVGNTGNEWNKKNKIISVVFGAVILAIIIYFLVMVSLDYSNYQLNELVFLTIKSICGYRGKEVSGNFNQTIINFL